MNQKKQLETIVDYFVKTVEAKNPEKKFKNTFIVFEKIVKFRAFRNDHTINPNVSYNDYLAILQALARVNHKYAFYRKYKERLYQFQRTRNEDNHEIIESPSMAKEVEELLYEHILDFFKVEFLIEFPDDLKHFDYGKLYKLKDFILEIDITILNESFDKNESTNSNTQELKNTIQNQESDLIKAKNQLRELEIRLAEKESLLNMYSKIVEERDLLIEKLNELERLKLEEENNEEVKNNNKNNDKLKKDNFKKEIENEIRERKIKFDSYTEQIAKIDAELTELQAKLTPEELDELNDYKVKGKLLIPDYPNRKLISWIITEVSNFEKNRIFLLNNTKNPKTLERDGYDSEPIFTKTIEYSRLLEKDIHKFKQLTYTHYSKDISNEDVLVLKPIGNRLKKVNIELTRYHNLVIICNNIKDFNQRRLKFILKLNVWLLVLSTFIILYCLFIGGDSFVLRLKSWSDFNSDNLLGRIFGLKLISHKWNIIAKSFVFIIQLVIPFLILILFRNSKWFQKYRSLQFKILDNHFVEKFKIENETFANFVILNLSIVLLVQLFLLSNLPLLAILGTILLSLFMISEKPFYSIIDSEINEGIENYYERLYANTILINAGITIILIITAITTFNIL